MLYHRGCSDADSFLGWEAFTRLQRPEFPTKAGAGRQTTTARSAVGVGLAEWPFVFATVTDFGRQNRSFTFRLQTSWKLHYIALHYICCHGKCIFADHLQMSHACHRFWKCYKTLTFCSLLTRCTIAPNPSVFLHFWLGNVLRATTACTFATSQLLKVLRSWGVFRHLNFRKCSEREVFLAFSTLDMCFAPQRRALFRHLNFKKCSEREVLLAFHLDMCFAPQRRAIFPSHLASWLRTRRFSEPTFRPSGATNQWKNTVFRDSLSFSRTWIFFLLRLSLFSIFFLFPFLSLTLPISAFHLSILSEVWLLNFLRQWCNLIQ